MLLAAINLQSELQIDATEVCAYPLSVPGGVFDAISEYLKLSDL